MTRKWVVQPLTSAEEAKGTGWHHYTESGLDNVWLQGGVAHHETPYGPGVAIDDVDGINAAVADWIVERKSYWRGREIKFLRKRLNLSQKGLADLLGYSDQQVRRWENDVAEMPSPASAPRDETAPSANATPPATPAPHVVRQLQRRTLLRSHRPSLLGLEIKLFIPIMPPNNTTDK